MLYLRNERDIYDDASEILSDAYKEIFLSLSESQRDEFVENAIEDFEDDPNDEQILFQDRLYDYDEFLEEYPKDEYPLFHKFLTLCSIKIENQIDDLQKELNEDAEKVQKDLDTFEEEVKSYIEEKMAKLTGIEDYLRQVNTRNQGGSVYVSYCLDENGEIDTSLRLSDHLPNCGSDAYSCGILRANRAKNDEVLIVENQVVDVEGAIIEAELKIDEDFEEYARIKK